MIALMPVVDCAAPDRAADLVDEGETLAALGRSHAELTETMDVRLLLWVFAGRTIAIDRIGARPAHRQSDELRASENIAHERELPERIVAVEELRRAHRQRIDHAHVAADVVFGLERDQSRRDQIRVGRAERPVEIVRERHP